MLIKSGFPASTEAVWYGESPNPVGPIGKTCQAR